MNRVDISSIGGYCSLFYNYTEATVLLNINLQIKCAYELASL